MSEKPFGYPKGMRLLNAKDYQTVFDKVDVKAPCEHFLMLARFNTLKHSRLGFIFSKKNIRFAVQRNRIKRVTKDYFRLHNTEVPDMDIIILARKGIDKLSNEEVRQLLKKQFNKLTKRSQQTKSIKRSLHQPSSD
ncbi:ribonuclease P protein component [Reinekea thalattae]|uniref:Ribonuclease P protein component n=1 Tax=Reinekea thalattae TaxID=2593301 RepID=A0A5C8ZC31_9GAMM|nr:ribonuclease P protein component [Reinekea thalattae]TXR54723.1 ribonuclease P protein component [Reinekea thalattae]